MSNTIKKYVAKNMDIAEKLGKELLRLWISDGYERPFLQHSFIPYEGEDRNSRVTIFAMQGSPIRGFVVVFPQGEVVRVFNGRFSEIFRIEPCHTLPEYQTRHYKQTGYSPKIKTFNPDFKKILL